MAGTILTSSPHYFYAVEYYHAYLVKNWLALATKSHCLYEQTNLAQPAYVEKIPYSMPIDSWHPCTESSNEPAQAYTHWPTGCPNRPRMKDPSLHEPSKKVLQMKTCALALLWAFMLIKNVIILRVWDVFYVKLNLFPTFSRSWSSLLR